MKTVWPSKKHMGAPHHPESIQEEIPARTFSSHEITLLIIIYYFGSKLKDFSTIGSILSDILVWSTHRPSS